MINPLTTCVREPLVVLEKLHYVNLRMGDGYLNIGDVVFFRGHGPSDGCKVENRSGELYGEWSAQRFSVLPGPVSYEDVRRLKSGDALMAREDLLSVPTGEINGAGEINWSDGSKCNGLMFNVEPVDRFVPESADPSGYEGVWDVGGIGYRVRWDSRGCRYTATNVKSGIGIYYGYRDLLEAIDKKGWRKVEGCNSMIASGEPRKPSRRLVRRLRTPVDPYDMG
jgi:hypothetical protein